MSRFIISFDILHIAFHLIDICCVYMVYALELNVQYS